MTTAADRRPAQPGMTTERAIALADCAAEGRCFPRCAHCTASRADVEAARAWLEQHPDELQAWAVSELAGALDILRHWTSRPAGPDSGASRWQVLDGEMVIADGLTAEQAEALVGQHNRQVTAALGKLEWYLGE